MCSSHQDIVPVAADLLTGNLKRVTRIRKVYIMITVRQITHFVPSRSGFVQPQMEIEQEETPNGGVINKLVGAAPQAQQKGRHYDY